MHNVHVYTNIEFSASCLPPLPLATQPNWYAGYEPLLLHTVQYYTRLAGSPHLTLTLPELPHVSSTFYSSDHKSKQFGNRHPDSHSALWERQNRKISCKLECLVMHYRTGRPYNAAQSHPTQRQTCICICNPTALHSLHPPTYIHAYAKVRKDYTGRGMLESGVLRCDGQPYGLILMRVTWVEGCQVEGTVICIVG
jgi:hypothetical protein